MENELSLLKNDGSLAKLTPREQEVMAMILRGASNKAIGEALFISIKTVEFHISNILQKFGLKNRIELISFLMGEDPFDWHKN